MDASTTRPTRKKNSSSVEKRLHAYYGGKRCVVLGQPGNVHWHHLDDDIQRSTFVNQVPLSNDFNLNLRDVREKTDTPLLPRLDPDNLLKRASLHFADWEIALAYGSARLGTFVAAQYLQWVPDRRVPLIAATLYYARNRTDYDLILDVFERDLNPAIITGELSRHSKAIILRELASLFTEHGHAKEAVELYQWVDILQPIAEVTNPREFGALLRRRYMTLGAANGWLRQREAEVAYQHALATDPSENLAVSVANSRAWTYLDLNRFDKAYDALHPLFEKYRHKAFSPVDSLAPVDVTVWNIAELMHGFSLASMGARGKRGLLAGGEAFRKAAEAYRNCGLRPYIVREGFLTLGSQMRARYADLEGITLPLREPLPAALFDQAIALVKKVTSQ